MNTSTEINELATALAKHLDIDVHYEPVEDNEYLADFYRDKKGAAFRTQMFFLMSRHEQLKKLAQGELFRIAKDVRAVVRVTDQECAVVDSVALPRVVEQERNNGKENQEAKQIPAAIRGTYDGLHSSHPPLAQM